MNYLTIDEIIEAHRALIEQTGGSDGLRDRGSLESCLAQPQMTFGGQDLYPTLADKAAALGFAIVRNHPFVDGNKRAGLTATALFLYLNGWLLIGHVDDVEAAFLKLAAGELSRDEFTDWVKRHIHPNPDV